MSKFVALATAFDGPKVMVSPIGTSADTAWFNVTDVLAMNEST